MGVLQSFVSYHHTLTFFYLVRFSISLASCNGWQDVPENGDLEEFFMTTRRKLEKQGHRSARKAKINNARRRAATAIHGFDKLMLDLPPGTFASFGECFAEMRRVANDPSLSSRHSPEIVGSIYTRAQFIVITELGGMGVDFDAMDEDRYNVFMGCCEIGAHNGIADVIWPNCMDGAVLLPLGVDAELGAVYEWALITFSSPV
ncbi:hypothetical protein JKG47_09555 [Acidithiobacillus sp. MC6.1]|nr:hypothetical protein [Acidithiobacillus sp. MC6.1]